MATVSFLIFFLREEIYDIAAHKLFMHLIVTSVVLVQLIMELHGTLTQDRNQECNTKSNLQYADMLDIGVNLYINC